MLFQSSGGIVGDGVALHNYLRACPVEVTAYNVGTVASIATIAFLGATNRITSKFFSFMIHKSFSQMQGLTAERARAAIMSIVLDDERVEAILAEKATFSEEKLTTHKNSDLWFGADEALKAKVATAIGEFAPPINQMVFHI
jgi:ATP-dependent Clp protease protease subunit